MKLPPWLELLLLLVRFVVVAALVLGGAFVVIMIIFVVGMASGPESISRTIYPSPDRKVSAIEVESHGGGAAGATGWYTYLVGGTFSAPVELGEHIFTFGRWVDDQTVEVCGEVAGSRASVQVIGEDGVARSYRVAVNCPDRGGSELGHE